MAANCSLITAAIQPRFRLHDLLPSHFNISQVSSCAVQMPTWFPIQREKQESEQFEKPPMAITNSRWHWRTTGWEKRRNSRRKTGFAVRCKHYCTEQERGATDNTVARHVFICVKLLAPSTIMHAYLAQAFCFACRHLPACCIVCISIPLGRVSLVGLDCPGFLSIQESLPRIRPPKITRISRQA